MTETLDHSAAETPPNPSAIPADELARMTDDIVAAMKTVFGEMETYGHLPVSIPGMYPRGHGLLIGARK